MKRATIAAITALAMAAPHFAIAQGDAKATVTAKLKALVNSAGEPAPNGCAVVNAADYGRIQEAACEGGLGYMIVTGDKGPVAIHCAQVAADVNAAGKLDAACQLPENRDELKVVDAVAKVTDTPCNIIARSYFGETPSGSSVFLEGVCDNGKGYLFQVWKDPADVKAFGNKAWICDADFKSRGNDCEVTKTGVAGARAAEAKRVALLDAYYKGAAAPPTAVAVAPSAAPAGAAPAGAAPASSAYTGTVSAAWTKAISDSGMSCPTKPPKLREETDDHTILEFRCTSRDDGRVGIFSKTGKPTTVVDCGSVVMLGFKCEDTEEKAGWAAMSTAIRRVASGTSAGECSVSATKVMGVGPTTATIEAKCTDPRIGGVVLTYNRTTGRLTSLVTCQNFASSPGQSARCSLPGAFR